MWSHVQNFESSEGLVAEIIPALFMHSFFQKKTLKMQDFPKLMNYQSKSIFSLTYIIINLCTDFIC